MRSLIAIIITTIIIMVVVTIISKQILTVSLVKQRNRISTGRMSYSVS